MPLIVITVIIIRGPLIDTILINLLMIKNNKRPLTPNYFLLNCRIIRKPLVVDMIITACIYIL